MEVQEAIDQVALIRRQLARAELFRGYRSSAAAASAVLALATAWAQVLLIPDPASRPIIYVGLWALAALVATLTSAVPLVHRARLDASPLLREKTYSALGMLAPCLAAGALVTLTLLVADASVLWLLPGLWSVMFGLGVFASLPVLPRPMAGVGSFYLFAGAAALGLARGSDAFSPWAMILTFGVGQLLAAAVLFWCLERPSPEDTLDHR